MIYKDVQGRIQDFQIEGAQDIMCTQGTFQGQSVKSLSTGVKGPLDRPAWKL